MSNSILTTITTTNTIPHRKLNDEQLNPQKNNKNHNTTQKPKR